MPVLDRGGVRIAYDLAGAGPVVLLTPGFAATSAMFAANVDALATDHTVVTWDIRGHGASDSPADPAAYSAALTLGDMLALLDAVGAERAVFGGHSLGGYLSLELTVESPGRVAGLLLIGTGPGYRNDDGREGWNRFATRYAARLREKGLAALPESEELRSAVHRDAAGLEHAAMNILSQRDSRVMDGLDAIEVPALIVVGSDDDTFMGSAHYMAGKIPNAVLEVVDGAHHAPNVSHPELFNARARAFLESLGTY